MSGLIARVGGGHSGEAVTARHEQAQTKETVRFWSVKSKRRPARGE
jgi:hypothetical protein